MIETLNRYFVPVYAVNEDYESGALPADERKERERIWGEASQRKLPWGMVCSYFLEPEEGHLVETGPVAKYTTAEVLLPLLERVARDLKVEPGETIIPPAPQSASPPGVAGGLTLRLTARYLDAEGKVEPLHRRSTYHELPAENWIVLGATECEKLAPPAPARAGATWEIAPEVARKLLVWFYPPIEDNANISLEAGTWSSKILSVESGIVRIRFDGTSTVKHLNFYHRETFTIAQTKFAGFMDYDLGEKRVKSLGLASESGRYADQFTFAIAVQAVP